MAGSCQTWTAAADQGEQAPEDAHGQHRHEASHARLSEPTWGAMLACAKLCTILGRQPVRSTADTGSAQMPDSNYAKTRTIMLVTSRVAYHHVQRPNSLLLRGQGSAGLQGADAAQAGAGRQLPCQAVIQEWPARLTSFCWSSCPSSSWSGWSRSSSSSSSSSCIVRGEQHIWRCASYAVDIAQVQGRLNSSSGR